MFASSFGMGRTFLTSVSTWERKKILYLRTVRGVTAEPVLYNRATLEENDYINNSGTFTKFYESFNGCFRTIKL